jgi:histidinol-phosphate aminotransferase
LRPTSKQIANLEPYDPKYLPAQIYLNANENNYGAPQGLYEALAKMLQAQSIDLSLHRYPDPLCLKLRELLASYHGVNPEQVLVGNGGDELILDLILAWGGNGRKLLIAPPCFSSYELSAALNGTEVVQVPRIDKIYVEKELVVAKQGDATEQNCATKQGDATEQNSATEESATAEQGVAIGQSDAVKNLRCYDVDEEGILARVACGDIDIVMLASPNNPTGDLLSAQFVNRLCTASDAIVLIDEAYIDFADTSLSMQSILHNENLVLLRTFSKAWGLAGVRLGYLLASAEVIRNLAKVRQPYSVSRFAAATGCAALEFKEQVAKTSSKIITERQRVLTLFSTLKNIEYYRSDANFVLLRMSGAHEFWQWLHSTRAILLRDLSSSKGLKNCLRLTIGKTEENDAFFAALHEWQGARYSK